jgi:hypothetical protein
MTVVGRCAARSRAEAIQLLVMEVVHKPFQAFRTPPMHCRVHSRRTSGMDGQ